MKTLLKMIIFTIVLVSLSESEKLPKIFQKCDFKQSDFKTCLRLAVEDALHQLKGPIPEMDLPGFEPLFLTRRTIPNHNKTNFSIKEDLNSIALYNITTAKVQRFDVDFEEKTVKAVFAIEDFQIIFYNMTLNGKAYGETFNFTTHGIGKYGKTIFNISAVFEELVKENDHFLNVVDAKLLWNADNIEFTADSENKEAAEHYTHVVQAHVKEVFETIIVDYDIYFASLFVRFANNVFSRVSILEMFNL